MIWRHLACRRVAALDRQLRQLAGVQETALKRALRQVRGTRLAADLGLAGVEGIDAFRRRAPITDYYFYEPYIDAAITGRRDVMFRGAAVRIAQTGGTTGKPKQLPLNRSLIRAYRRFNLDMVFRYMVESGHFDILNDRIFLVAANPAVEETVSGTAVGFITGIMADIAPRILQRRFVPSIDVLRNPVMEEKIRQICEQGYANRLRVRIALGLTPYLMASWNNLQDYAAAVEGRSSEICEIFPHLRVAFHGGSTFALFRQRMQRISGPGVAHRNVYSAAEGPIAAQYCQETPGLVAAVSDVFLEFIPESEADSAAPETLLLDEVQTGVPYYLVMTTPGGLLRYRIGDRVQFIQTDPPLLVVLGKAEDQIDVSAEKLTAEQAAKVLCETADALGAKVLDFLVCPIRGVTVDQKPAHEWIIECDTPPDAPDVFQRQLESRLCEQSPMYRELREHDFSLGSPQLTFVERGTFQRYMEAELNFGQQKMMHMHNDRRTAERVLDHARSG